MSEAHENYKKGVREDVYKAIDSEREYQDRRWGNTMSGDRVPGCHEQGGDRTVDEFILYIAGYTNDLVENASHFADTDVKLDIIRKVTALGVAAMEQHGAPLRLIPIELRISEERKDAVGISKRVDSE